MRVIEEPAPSAPRVYTLARATSLVLYAGFSLPESSSSMSSNLGRRRRKVWVSYNSPEYLEERHNIRKALMQNISGIRSIVEEADACGDNLKLAPVPFGDRLVAAPISCLWGRSEEHTSELQSLRH